MTGMDDPDPTAKASQAGASTETTAPATAGLTEPVVARGSGVIASVPERTERTEHSVMEGLPKDKAERVAAMRRELAALQTQLIEAQQRIATELQGRADDAERIETLEGRLQAATELETAIAELRVQLETRTTALNEAKTLLEARTAELATERDSETSVRSRLERELEDQRKQSTEAKDQLELQFTALRDANALVVARDTELAAMTAERDAARAELETGRAKAREIASQIARFGQELGDGGVVVASPAVAAEAKPEEQKSNAAIAIPRRPQPPPVPAMATVPETIFEVTEEPKPASHLRSGLLLIGGLIAGCAVTFAIMNSGGASSAAGAREELAAPAPAAAMHVDQATTATPAVLPTPAAEMQVNAPTNEVTATPTPAPAAEVPTDGVIVLPPSAAGHRVYVDGKVVDVKDSRSTVTCGTHEIRIGSSGSARTLDVTSGGETVMSAAL
jgi:hypothetical protein